jgi:hypothetical protein
MGVLKNRMPADNERFYESGGVCPQTVLYDFSSASPARTFVSPRLHKAATTLYANRRQCSGQRLKVLESLIQLENK